MDWEEETNPVSRYGFDSCPDANPAGHVEERPYTSPVEAPRYGRSITPARRLDAAPDELRASSTRQTITARLSTSARSSTTPDGIEEPNDRQRFGTMPSACSLIPSWFARPEIV